MPNGFKDKDGWIASFRDATGKRRRIRIPKGRVSSKPEADAYAAECERYADIVGRMRYPSEHDIDHALHLKAITEAQATARREQTGLPPSITQKPISILDAWEMHPSTQRESRNDTQAYERRLKDLKEFTAETGVSLMKDLTYQDVLGYLNRMIARGISYHGRRHKLLPLRRACRMAPSYGLGDVLYGLKLDQPDRASQVIDAWTFRELAAAAQHFGNQKNYRALTALGLGGFMGLRNSEVMRVLKEDIEGDILHIGRRDAKNSASVRSLVMPEVVAGWLHARAKELKIERTLVAPEKRLRNKPNSPYGRHEFRFWFRPLLAEGTGRTLAIKCLRKSFTTITYDAGLDPYWIERYLGHAAALSTATNRSYLSRSETEKMRPFVADLNALYATALATEFIDR